ncbi:ferredoxin [Caballeronia megalochromosomata]|nr:ferredoxin [Caballeronia megalochromosomata]
MPVVTYLERDSDTPKVVDLRVGQSLMEGAVANRVRGIQAECGGACMCATCHVYIDGGPVNDLAPVSDEEDAMLSEAIGERRENSRLGCQVRMTAELDGLIVRIADNG